MSGLIDSEKEMQQSRPKGLTVLCVLTFISTGFSLLTELFNLFKGPMNKEQLNESKVEMSKAIDEMRSLNMDAIAEMFEKLQRITEVLNAQFYFATLTTIVVLSIGLLAAFFMWQGKKAGFHLYIVYSLLVAVQLYLFVSPSTIPTAILVWNILISGLFVLLYSRHLKHLSR
jgi:hypothetical protein